VAEDAMTGKVAPFKSVQFASDQDVACLAAALETGNPATGPSTWILKAPAGCVVPWHSHTAGEQLIIVTGSVLGEMRGQPPTQLDPGGFAMMPSHMAHKFTCQGPDACVMFATFDRTYDIKWEAGP
jgi:anti-sigma factor ChrR (cupin superfamily)